MFPKQGYFLNKILTLIPVLTLGACQHNSKPYFDQNEELPPAIQNKISKFKLKEMNYVEMGLQAFLKGDYKQASAFFNHVLSYQVGQSSLHTLNAFSYELMAQNGDLSAYDLAEAGYNQAKKCNPNNKFASLRLGVIKIEKKNYKGAQNEFAELLLLDPQNQEGLYGLALSSYLVGDLKTALAIIERLLERSPENNSYIRAGALIYSAAGDSVKAQSLLNRYAPENQSDKMFLEGRMQDWIHLHELQWKPLPQVKPHASYAQKEKSESPVIPKTMVTLDLVVLRVIEESGRSVGSNILHNFTVTLAPYARYFARGAGPGTTPDTSITGVNVFPLNTTAFPAESLSSELSNTAGTVAQIPGAVNSELKKNPSIIVGGISFGSLNYALNIANSSSQYIKMMARPTLMSYLGKPSEFFAGEALSIGQTSSFGGGSISQSPAGNRVRVTPSEITDDYVILDIELINSTFEEDTHNIVTRVTNSANPNVIFNTITSNLKTTVKAKIGDTVSLADISSSVNIHSDTGFPGLRDTPVIKYAFGNETDNLQTNSLLYLLTPRHVDNTSSTVRNDGDNKDAKESTENLSELEIRHDDWFEKFRGHNFGFTNYMPTAFDFRDGDLKSLSDVDNENAKKMVFKIVEDLG